MSSTLRKEPTLAKKSSSDQSPGSQDIINQRPAWRENVRPEEATKLALAGVEVNDITSINGRDSYLHPDHSRSGAFWSFLVIIVVVTLFVTISIWNSDSDGWFSSLQKPDGLTIQIFVPIWILFFILIIVVTYVGHVETSNEYLRMNLTWAFLLQMVILVGWAIAFYDFRLKLAGFALAIAAFVLTIWWMYLIYPVNKIMFVLLGIYLIWLAYIILFQWLVLTRKD